MNLGYIKTKLDALALDLRTASDAVRDLATIVEGSAPDDEALRAREKAIPEKEAELEKHRQIIANEHERTRSTREALERPL